MKDGLSHQPSHTIHPQRLEKIDVVTGRGGLLSWPKMRFRKASLNQAIVGCKRAGYQILREQ